MRRLWVEFKCQVLMKLIRCHRPEFVDPDKHHLVCLAHRPVVSWPCRDLQALSDELMRIRSREILLKAEKAVHSRHG